MLLTKNLSNLFLDIFYPKRCVGCGKYGLFVCLDCAKEVEMLKTSVCPECGKITTSCQYCPACRTRLKTALSGIFIASRYDAGPTKEIIHHLKYSGFIELSELLGELLCEKLSNNSIPSNCVVAPVPLYRKKELERGFNQAELIARYISKKLNISGGDALIRSRNTRTQVGLNRGERIRNCADAFACLDPELVLGKNVLLVDDVVTTGTTLSECAKVLKIAGAKRVYGVVVAKRI